MSKAKAPEASEEALEPAKEGTRENRFFRRRSVLWPARLIVGRHEFSCQVWNLSLGGARVRMDLPLQEGTELVLSVKGRGDISAEVAWTKDGSMGLNFNVSPESIKEMFADRLHVLGLDATD